MLHEFVTANREEIISRCRGKAATRSDPPAIHMETEHGVPMFLDQLVDELLGLSPNPEITKTAKQHGHDLLRQGFNVSEVVHHYGDVCQSITEMALELNAPISTADFRMLNRCLDDAIAGAVVGFGRERDQSINGEGADETEHLAVLARALRNSIYTATVALHVIQSGSVGIAGSTGKVLHQNLSSAHDLIDRLLAEVEVNAARRSTDPVTS